MAEPTRLGDDDLLEYNAEHRLLICRQCEFAIQKSALESHLLRHKIYRIDRRRLLAELSGLDLAEPDHVSLPDPSSPPVPGIAVLSGFRCTVDDCRHLTVSVKRMKRHLSETHGTRGIFASFLPSFARPAQLQTFFRGTKTRYFEVTASSVDIDVDADDSEVGPEPDHSHEALASTPPRPVSPSHSTASPHGLSLDLETLAHFHHFTSQTVSSLPDDVEKPAAQHWQSDVLRRAPLGGVSLLAECCRLSYRQTQYSSVLEADGRAAAMNYSMQWRAVATWFAALPSHFDGLVRARHPAALIVLGYWAAAVLRRAGGECWFLRNSAAVVVGVIGREFKERSDGVEGLLWTLMREVDCLVSSGAGCERLWPDGTDVV